MNELFNSVLSDTSGEISVPGVALAIAVSVLLGLLIAFVYSVTSDESYQRELALTLLMLPAILSVIIIFVGSNIARAFSLAGTLSIIRFRSAPGDPKDIGFIFFSIAAGFASGVGLYGYGALFAALLSVIIVIAEKKGLFLKKTVSKKLRITVPEDLNYEGAFDEVLKKYTEKFSPVKVKTTDLGSLFEIEYSLVMRRDKSEREFINELRCRNGNLNIVLALAPSCKTS